MNLREALQEMREHGYVMQKKTKLQEAIDCVKQYGYLVEEEQQDEFEDDDAEMDSGKDHIGDENNAKEELKKLIHELRDIDGYEKFVKHLAQLKGHQVELLRQIVGNGKFAKNTQAKTGKIPVFKLIPVQREIDADASLGFPLQNKKNAATSIPVMLDGKEAITVNNSPLLIYKHSDGKYYIIDGHHRWSQVYLFNPKARMNIILFTMVADGNENPIDVLRDFQAVIKATTGEVKVAEVKGANLFEQDDKALYDYVMKTMSDAALEQWHKAEGHGEDTKEQCAELIMNNGKQMKANNKPQAFDGENPPPRTVMPQTDKRTIAAAAKGMLDV